MPDKHKENEIDAILDRFFYELELELNSSLESDGDGSDGFYSPQPEGEVVELGADPSEEPLDYSFESILSRNAVRDEEKLRREREEAEYIRSQRVTQEDLSFDRVVENVTFTARNLDPRPVQPSEQRFYSYDGDESDVRIYTPGQKGDVSRRQKLSAASSAQTGQKPANDPEPDERHNLNSYRWIFTLVFALVNVLCIFWISVTVRPGSLNEIPVKQELNLTEALDGCLTELRSSLVDDSAESSFRYSLPAQQPQPRNADIAICLGNDELRWSSAIIALAVLSAFTLASAIYGTHVGRETGLWIMLPFTVMLSVFFSRLFHWYANPGAYRNILYALTDITRGGFCLMGIVPAVLIAARITVNLDFENDAGRLLDSLAPSLPLSMGLIRLSAIFTGTCLGTLTVSLPVLQRMPFAVYFRGEYLLAVFILEYFVFLIICVIMVKFYYTRRKLCPFFDQKEDGNAFRISLLLVACVELFFDGLRLDASYLRLLSSVSAERLLCLLIIGLTVFHYGYPLKKRSDLGSTPAIWLGLFVLSYALNAAARIMPSEGLLSWLMALVSLVSVLLMALCVWRVYILSCRRPPADSY